MPSQYEPMTALLNQHGLLRSARVWLTVTAAAAGMAPLIMLTASEGTAPAAFIANVTAGAYVAVSIGAFAHQWPSRRLSALLATGGAAVIAGWSLAQSDPTLQFLACAVLVIPGAFLAIFHSTRLMTLSFTLSAITAVAAAVRTADRASVATAATSFCVLWLLDLAIPLGARGLSRGMARYAADSHHDPLTGLLNRRGFTRQVSDAATISTGHTHLAVLLVDLDDFKAFNDTWGHPQGDQLLVEVARLLAQACPGLASICRAGGEEFLIAYPTTDTGPPPIATRLCQLVAALPHGVTVSIGTAAAALRGLNSSGALDTLVGAADIAMYGAKRAGGNQTRHHRANGATAWAVTERADDKLLDKPPC